MPGVVWWEETNSVGFGEYGDYVVQGHGYGVGHYGQDYVQPEEPMCFLECGDGSSAEYEE